MKRFISLVSALLCVFGLSAMSFAATSVSSVSPTSFSFVRDEGSHYLLDYVFPVSRLDASGKEYWADCMSALQGDSSNSFCLINAGETNSVSTFSFMCIDSDYVIRSGKIYPSSGGTFKNIWFTYDKASSSFKDASVITSSSTSLADIFFGFGNLSSSGVSSILKDLSIKYVDWGGKRLQLSDDLNPDDPDPPSSSSSEPSESIPDTPKPPPYNPTIPTIPQGGQYVPYDTSIWNTFLERIKANIGSATNIGFLIFGVSVVWAILIRVVKRFTKAD